MGDVLKRAGGDFKLGLGGGRLVRRELFDQPADFGRAWLRRLARAGIDLDITLLQPVVELEFEQTAARARIFRDFAGRLRRRRREQQIAKQRGCAGQREYQQPGWKGGCAFCWHFGPAVGRFRPPAFYSVGKLGKS